MPNRPYRSRSEWQDLLNEFASLDVSAQQFCNERGLGYASFIQWRKLLSSRTNKPAASFVDLSSLAAPASDAGSTWNSAARALVSVKVLITPNAYQIVANKSCCPIRQSV